MVPKVAAENRTAARMKGLIPRESVMGRQEVRNREVTGQKIPVRVPIAAAATKKNASTTPGTRMLATDCTISGKPISLTRVVRA